MNILTYYFRRKNQCCAKIQKNKIKLLGSSKSLINNAVIGVGKGYEQTLKLNGVGFKQI